MPVVSVCCNPCDPSTVTEVPGVQGAPGTNGTDGANAFTVTTTVTWNVPVLGANTASLAFGDTTWMVVGQPVFVAGAGLFTVVSKADATHAVLNYTNYLGNTASGNPILAGAQVSPSGPTPTTGVVFTGSPEGVVSAPVGTVGLDDAADNFWFKKTGSGNTGWVQLIG